MRRSRLFVPLGERPENSFGHALTDKARDGDRIARLHQTNGVFGRDDLLLDTTGDFVSLRRSFRSRNGLHGLGREGANADALHGAPTQRGDANDRAVSVHDGYCDLCFSERNLSERGKLESVYGVILL